MSSDDEHPDEAVEVQPRRPGDGSRPTVHSFPRGRRPMMRIRIEGAWRTAVVEARYDYEAAAPPTRSTSSSSATASSATTTGLLVGFPRDEAARTRY